MSNVVIVGAQWGDEGKGKVVDLFTSWADVVVRFQGGANAGHQLVVSENAHVILPYHKRIDVGREQKTGRTKIGTTGRGIGPCYEDKVARRGIRMRDLLKRH